MTCNQSSGTMVNMSNRSDAPGDLEDVRTFLNTWAIPNDSRMPVDDLDDLAGDRPRWAAAMPSLPAPAGGQVAALRRLRDNLRAALGQEHPLSLRPRLEALRLRARLAEPGQDGPAVRFAPERPTAETAILGTTLEAVRAGWWHRLRACPDCGWVFYDSSRNARRTWCSMTAGQGTRGCGSIAKTRSYRARRGGRGG